MSRVYVAAVWTLRNVRRHVKDNNDDATITNVMSDMRQTKEFLNLNAKIVKN